MWSLADDLEHALAHRDPRDWYVFEAASWALAAQRMLAREAPSAVARAAASRRTGRPAPRHSVVRLCLGRRVVPHRRAGPPGPPRTGPGALRGRASGRVAPVPARRAGQRQARPAAKPRELGAPDVLGVRSRHRRQSHAATVRAVDTAICLVADHRGIPVAAVGERRDRAGDLPLADRSARGAGMAHGDARADCPLRSNGKWTTPACSRSTVSCCCNRARCSHARPRLNWSVWPASLGPSH